MSGANKIVPLDPVTVSTLMATDVVATATAAAVSAPRKEQLAASLSEVQIETQTLGASLLVVTLIDPGWVIQRSGFLTPDADGLLPDIEVEFPKNTGMWWSLAMVEGTNDLSQPNLTLTFQDRIVNELNGKWGPKGVASGTTTRAQFIHQLVQEVGRGDGLVPITFVCPEINQLQPVQTTTLQNEGTTTVLDGVTAQHKADKTNKAKGVGQGASITVKGQPPNAEQIKNINIAMSLSEQFSAPVLAQLALVEACIQESSFLNLSYGDGSSTGILQFLATTSKTIVENPMDVTECITAFLTKNYYTLPGWNYGSPEGGAIVSAKTNPTATADQVAQAAQGSAFPAAYGQWAAEAQAIVKAAGGANVVGGTAATASDVGQLTRGTSDNPDEGSWDCCQRLASEVNWSLFSNGNILYYMDGPTLAAQKPALYLKLDASGTTWTVTNPADGATGIDLVSSLSYTFDNTAFNYQATHTKKGKVQHQTRIRTPQTPSQIKFNLICGILDYRAGDVFVFQDAGPINGRWIVEDATRNCLGDTFTQLTLGPPTLPDLEPAATTTGANLSGNTGIGPTTGSASGGSPGKANSQITSPGTGVGAAQAAQIALGQRTMYVYSEQADRGNNGTLFGPSPRTMDCSAFVTLCYKAAGLPDPSHANFNPIGWTGSIIPHCTAVSGNEQPGDLCFYGPSVSDTKHVTIYVGNGQVISMGKQGDPDIGGAAVMGPAGFLGFWRPDVLPNASAVVVPPGQKSPVITANQGSFTAPLPGTTTTTSVPSLWSNSLGPEAPGISQSSVS